MLCACETRKRREQTRKGEGNRNNKGKGTILPGLRYDPCKFPNYGNLRM